MSKAISLLKKEKSRAILFRSGGIGDFILTLPLLDYLINSYTQVYLVTKPAYYFLINKWNRSIKFFDLDFGVNPLRKEINATDIYTFWNDKEWVQELKVLGAKKIFILPTRPTSDAHFVESIFKIIKAPFSPTLLSKAWIGDEWVRNSTLWIHPGSGSKKKNVSISFFHEIADGWLDQNSSNKVNFSFGEADHETISFFQKENFTNPNNISFVQPYSINDYRKILQEGISAFWGNDSGPSHMAANLGIPTNVCFCSTNSKIWRPTGPKVKIHEFT